MAARFIKLDLANLASVHKAARIFDEIVPRIDVLINNAGIMAVEEHAKSVDGFESHFTTNRLGHFLLTHLLTGKVFAVGDWGRVVNLSSVGYELSELRFGDWNFSVSWWL